MLKEDNKKWMQTTVEEKEDCLDFMLEILNIKVVSEEDQDSINRQMILIADLIGRFYSKLTAPEIKEAMRMYAFRIFPNIKVFRLIDCVSVGEILSAYIEFRNQAVEPFLIKRNNLLNASVDLSHSEKEKIQDDFLKMIFIEIIEKGFSSDAWHLFNDLESKGKINPTVAEKKALYKKQLKIYELEEKSIIVNKYDSVIARSYLNSLVNKITSKTPIESVSNTCRSILVSNYLIDFVEDFEIFKKAME
jgi:hypothetical protein